jgi:hypothetical protein
LAKKILPGNVLKEQPVPVYNERNVKEMGVVNSEIELD